MFTLTHLLALCLSAIAPFLFFQRRSRLAQESALKRHKDQQLEVYDQQLDKLKLKRERILQKISTRSQLNEERDQNRLEELTEDDLQLDQLEKTIQERDQRQSERDEGLSERATTLADRKAELKQQRAALRSRNRDAFLKLEERAEVMHKDLRDTRKQELCTQAEVESQKQIQRQAVEVEAYRDQRANQLISLGCQRYYDPRPAERLLSYVELPKSPNKREALLHQSGELLQTLQAVTQVDFLVEDTNAQRLMLRNAPESYSREIARLTFDRWVNGGELTEVALKKYYQKATNRIEKEAKMAGNAAARRLNLKGIHPEILFLVGKLLFRTSYTQNQWQHAIEASELCGMMAEELGVDVSLARRATLLHDIGKVLWEETEAVGSHAVSGAAFAKDHGEIPEIVHPIAAHHNDEAPSTALAYLVIASDTLSGARPGARRETSEAFSQHVEQLEAICEPISGVQHMIIQGGREVRLNIDPRRHSDLEMTRLASSLAEQIEDECVFPGQIKVTALREVVASSVARIRERHRDSYSEEWSTSSRSQNHQGLRSRDHRQRY
jgi:ribonucrease Y